MDIDEKGAYFLCRFSHRNDLYREVEGNLVKIELFKELKAVQELGDIRCEFEVWFMKKERIECFIYGRLIMIVIMAFLSGSIRRRVWDTKRREVSFMKVIRHFQVKSFHFLRLITDPIGFGKFLFEEFLEACRLCKMDLRKRLSTAQKIRMIKLPHTSTA